jgi:hypothetical protein
VIESDPHARGRPAPAEHAPRIRVVQHCVAQLAQAVDLELEEEHLLCELGVLLQQLEHVTQGHEHCECTDDRCPHRWNCRRLVLYDTPDLMLSINKT